MSASTEGIKAEAAASPALGRFAGEVRRRFLVGTLSVVGGLLVWEVLSRLVVANALFLAAPSQIARGDLFAGAEAASSAITWPSAVPSSSSATSSQA